MFTDNEIRVKTCGAVPPTQGYEPCSRLAFHTGPCAHRYIERTNKLHKLVLTSAVISLLVVAIITYTINRSK
jgi:hypothetical protein